MFDYTMIMNRLRAVSSSDNSHPSVVIYRRFKGPTFSLPATAVPLKMAVKISVKSVLILLVCCQSLPVQVHSRIKIYIIQTMPTCFTTHI